MASQSVKAEALELVARAIAQGLPVHGFRVEGKAIEVFLSEKDKKSDDYDLRGTKL